MKDFIKLVTTTNEVVYVNPAQITVIGFPKNPAHSAYVELTAGKPISISAVSADYLKQKLEPTT